MARDAAFAPWAILGGLRLEIRAFHDADTDAPMKVRHEGLGDGAVRMAYDVGRHDWSRLRIDLVATFDEGDLRDVVHVGEDPASVVTVLVAVTCSKTKLRMATPLEADRKGRYRGTLTLDRADLAGVARLLPIAARRQPLTTHATPGRATLEGARLAEGPSVDLRIDESASPFEGGLDVTWEDFRGSPNPFRSEREDHLFDVDLDGPVPRLVLNRRHAQVHALLMGDAAGSNGSAAIRTSLLAHVGSATLTHLFHAALADLEPDEETGAVSMPDGWQGDVIRVLLPKLYADHSSENARRDALMSDVADVTGRASLERRLASAVQRHQLPMKTLQSIMRGSDE